jgi:hypothetical protein
LIFNTGPRELSPDLEVSQLGKKLDSIKIKLQTVIDFDAKFKVEKISEESIASKGTHVLDELVKIYGHMSDIKILRKNSEEENLVNLKGLFESEVIPKGFRDEKAPEYIFIDRTGAGLHLGARFSDTLLYVYRFSSFTALIDYFYTVVPIDSKTFVQTV